MSGAGKTQKEGYSSGMAKRTYTTCARTEELLRDYIRTMMIGNQDRLPGEQVLAEILHVSRRTLHKVILKMEERHLLARSGRCRRYVQEYRNLARAGRILFLSVGRQYTFQLPAMERLWNMLHPLLLRHGADVRLFLTNPETDPKSIVEQLVRADVILYAGSLSIGREKVMDILFQSQDEKNVISLIETQTQNFRNMIVLDNYAAGRMAAEYLIGSGCRKMLGIWEFCNNQDFSRRAQGFADSLSAHHLGGIESILWIPNGTISRMRETVDWALSEGFDGLFLMSDERISELLREPIASGRVPGITKVVTIDGTQECLRMTPVLPYINHASDKIAEEILEQITSIARGTFRNVRKHIYPALCRN